MTKSQKKAVSFKVYIVGLQIVVLL